MAGGPVTLIPTGPLTNIALLLAHHPDVVGDIERIVLMGGAIAEGNVTPAAEFNIWVDPEAAARVFASGLDVTMVGLDVTHRALMTSEHAERLRAAGRVGTMVGRAVGLLPPWHSRVYEFPGTPVHDALAVAHVIRGRPPAHRAPQRRDRLRVGAVPRRTVVDLWRISGREPNAHVAVEVEGDAFLDLLVEPRPGERQRGAGYEAGLLRAWTRRIPSSGPRDAARVAAARASGTSGTRSRPLGRRPRGAGARTSRAARRCRVDDGDGRTRSSRSSSHSSPTHSANGTSHGATGGAPRRRRRAVDRETVVR